MRIGILGGTFDPPHVGHLVVAEQAYFQLHLDKVWFAPVGQPPHKNVHQVTDIGARLDMTRLAIQDNPCFELSHADAYRPPPHYITTLFEWLVERYPLYELYLVIGGDSLMELPNWFQPNRLLQLAKLAVAHRPGYIPDMTKLETALPGIRTRIEWIDSPLIDIASRDLQRRVREGLPMRYLVTPEVSQFIIANNLYSGSKSETIQPLE